MSDNNDNGAPGRSLLAEMTTLRAEMEALRKGMLNLVELQREMHQTLVAAMNLNPITCEGEQTHASQI